MQITSEEMILDPVIRKLIIDEVINGAENIARKNCELRKHEIYRDQNKKWVMHALLKEGYRPQTLARMENRAANISICKKIVNKLAQAYGGGLQRIAEDPQSQESIDLLANKLETNTALKKSDRYRQLFKNAAIQVIPVESREESSPEAPKYKIAYKVLAPWEYDVIEDSLDKTKPMVFILTDFPERHQFHYNSLQGSEGYRTAGDLKFNEGDAREQLIADSPSDASTSEQRRLIWWTSKHHFTTDSGGEIISGPDTDNPIGVLPFVNLAMDQDGAFWAKGGEDVVDGSILLNKQLTDINYITFNQGWGQLVIAAKDVPKQIVGGPDNAFIFDVKDGDPTPQVFFASSNPPIAQWLETLRTTLSLLLSTNNLSPRAVSASLDVSNAASGIALMIDQSEMTQDVQDVQQLYQDWENYLWRVTQKWHALYHGHQSLVPELQEIPPIDNPRVVLKFHQLRPVVSEAERLDALKKRQELGISSTVDLIMIDNPDLSRDEAVARAAEILEENKKGQEMFLPVAEQIAKEALPEDEAEVV
jgi:hypothetical protein